MKKSFELPERMAHLALDERGYPIPYFAMHVNGKVDFRYSDPKKKEICRKYKKCWICGGFLYSNDFWMITGPIGRRNHTVSDEPMHEECARFSLAVCPHMLFLKAERKTDLFEGMPSQSPWKPSHLYLIQADKIKYLDSVHTQFREKHAEEFHYIDNRLVKNKLQKGP